MEPNTTPIAITRILRLPLKGSLPGPFSILKYPGVTASSSGTRPGIPCHASGNLMQTNLSLHLAHPETCGHPTVGRTKWPAIHQRSLAQTLVLEPQFSLLLFQSPMYVLCNGYVQRVRPQPYHPPLYQVSNLITRNKQTHLLLMSNHDLHILRGKTRLISSPPNSSPWGWTVFQ